MALPPPSSSAEHLSTGHLTEDQLYTWCSTEFGAALERLASAYEADLSLRQDLLQEIHVALWRSLKGFDERCSLRTWVYRVAHNTAATYIRRVKRHMWVELEEISDAPALHDPDRGLALERLLALVRQLEPLDRQVMHLFLEGQSAAEIAEITGISPANVATKLHRMKNVLRRQFEEGESKNVDRGNARRVAEPAGRDPEPEYGAGATQSAPL